MNDDNENYTHTEDNNNGESIRRLYRRHQKLVNVSTWVPNKVTLLDGREVLSTSEAYRAECEAKVLLKLSPSELIIMLEGIEKERTLRGRKKTEAEMLRVSALIQAHTT